MASVAEHHPHTSSLATFPLGLLRDVVAFFGVDDADTFAAVLATCAALNVAARPAVRAVFEPALLRRFPAFAHRRPFLPADYSFLRGYQTHVRLTEEGSDPVDPRGTVDDYAFVVELKLPGEDAPRSFAAAAIEELQKICTDRIEGVLSREGRSRDFDFDWVRLYAIQKASGRIGLLHLKIRGGDGVYRRKTRRSSTVLTMYPALVLLKNLKGTGLMAWAGGDEGATWRACVTCECIVLRRPRRGVIFVFGVDIRDFSEDPPGFDWSHSAQTLDDVLIMLERDIEFSL